MELVVLINRWEDYQKCGLRIRGNILLNLVHTCLMVKENEHADRRADEHDGPLIISVFA